MELESKLLNSHGLCKPYGLKNCSKGGEEAIAHEHKVQKKNRKKTLRKEHMGKSDKIQYLSLVTIFQNIFQNQLS